MDIARMALGFKLSYVNTMRECSRRARASCFFFKFLRIFFMNNRAKNNPQPCESYFSGGTKSSFAYVSESNANNENVNL